VTPADYFGPILPSSKIIDRMFAKTREYQSETAQVKKDVTYTEQQQKILKDLDNYHTRKALDWIDFDHDEQKTDDEVAAVTLKARLLS